MTTTRRFGTSLVCAAAALVPGSVAKWLEFDDGVQRYSFDIRTSGTGTQDVDVAVDTGVATKK
ncbi:hypothetical protein CIW49_28610 [Mycolicibacterium sp. P1-18]|uniref:hypothetical protein n=1 Tax=Mycolicibacterium sp. P1-18 TaxID=2024615 RepID=UPI0011F2FCEE|nr:hypothetical protein [Mycolicibacterium sp. P1-18]KAA0092758.1 hypothetical protein CIW49_28610 [Mycolicibacterium sp. P1-18]